jgi:hypothetical protein
MLVHLLAALLQLPAQQTPAPARPAADSMHEAAARSRTDSTGKRKREKQPPKRIPLTPELLSSAFKDPEARHILTLARQARMSQDSALQGYDATTYQRISAGFGFSKIGRERLAFRTESATHVRWRRGVGAYVDLTGSRSVIPIAGKDGRVEIDDDISPIPYYPGSETLWIGGDAAHKAVDENEGVIHPLAEGAEAYYTYESADSVTFRLPDGKAIQLRELKVRPREPRWNLAVGSLWFDMRGGQLVRAAYRMSVPMDIVAVAEADDPKAFDEVPAWVKPMIFPMTAQISAIGVEYGLYQGRFWLPRLQVAEGGAQVSMMRIPFKLQQKYTYSAVNAVEPLPPIVSAKLDSTSRSDSTSRADSTTHVEAGIHVGQSKESLDSARVARREARRRQCDSTGFRTRVRTSDENPNPVLIRIPCDSTVLANSPELPPSIYDEGEQTATGHEMDALVQQALSMGAQAAWSPQLPTFELERPRYNRIEALSVGGRSDQILGKGYSLHGTARIGVADLEPNVELTGSRSDLRRTLSLTAYNRLVSANDWGSPLSFGSSISAFLFGRDEGFYYRASGLELTSTPDVASASAFTWGLFAEQERTARKETNFSLAHAMSDVDFLPNVEAAKGTYVGARTRYTRSFGLDPQGFRLFSDFRMEGARGDTGSYGRAALDLTTSHGIGNGAVSLAVAGGSSVGVVPPQRFWFLGGSRTVRGQKPGAAAGDAFWLARAEIAHGLGVVRPVLFGDIGWAGDRREWRDIGQPLSGAGAGISILDGLIRFDLARGITPKPGKWRVDAYVEGRF